MPSVLGKLMLTDITRCSCQDGCAVVANELQAKATQISLTDITHCSCQDGYEVFAD